jgi:hypothetical protein
LPGDFTTLGTSAWESTVATNALVHMPFDQASAVAGAYASARAFNSLEDRIEDRWFELSSIGDPSDVTNADLRRVLRQLRVLTRIKLRLRKRARRCCTNMTLRWQH